MLEVRRISESNATIPGRRAPIPRPWLRKDMYHSHSISATEMDILSESRWELSWGKLSSCCLCGNKKSDETKNRTVFPLIRRDSSLSFQSGRYELYSSDEGSVSSFTDSDTSSSNSSSSYEEEDTPERIQRQQRVPETPPPSLTYRPQPISVERRSRSAGLPPMNPSFTQPQMTRNRADTGEYTKTSATTNTSRHKRRIKQFEFSPQSMAEIWREPGTVSSKAPLMPPLEVQVPDEQDYLKLDASCTSSYDDSTGFESWSFGGIDTPQGKDNTTIGLGNDRGQQAVDDWQRFPAPRPPRTTPRRRPRKTRRKNKADQPEMSTPVYLRKNLSLDDATTGTLLLSGWIAASFDNDTIESRLMKASSKIYEKDLYYMQILQVSESASILLYKSDGTLERSLVLQRDWTCESREITSQIGKFVTIKSPTSTIVRLLPISLDDSFFNGENLVPSKEFSRVRNKLFATGRGKVYAPDEQHDAATYILFSLDALVKQCGR